MGVNAAPAKLCKSTDVTGDRGAQVYLTKVIEPQKGRHQALLELPRLGMTIAFGSGEDNLNEVVVGVPARRLKDKSDSLRCYLYPGLFSDLSTSGGRGAFAIPRGPARKHPLIVPVGAPTQKDGAISQKHCRAPQVHRVSVIHDCSPRGPVPNDPRSRHRESTRLRDPH